MKNPHELIVVIFLAFVTNLARADVSGTLEAKFTGPLIADFPILFQLTIHNTGTDPLSFRYSGMAIPGAQQFIVTFSDAHGSARSFRLSNGYGGMGRQDAQITNSISFDAAAPPMPVGEYSVNIRCEEAKGGDRVQWPAMTLAHDLHFTVINDPKGREQAVKDLLKKTSADNFGPYVVGSFALDPAILMAEDNLLRTVASADKGKHVKIDQIMSIPPGDGPLFLQAAQARVKDVPQDHDVLQKLVFLARRGQSASDLDVLLTIARSGTGYSQLIAINDLGSYQPRSDRIARVLLEIAKESDAGRPFAMEALAIYQNPVGAAYLLDVLTKRIPGDRVKAALLLAPFRDQPEISKALSAAAHDVDINVRSNAEDALSDHPMAGAPVALP